ncbi:hypothetical protein QCA50_011185 [Cerrena zonata]|uniref:Uncharacterized protein n=1 Tax=Cerrena zonata TaxID=2478898 RepID=A0AAW0G6A4_9APHY
MPKDFTRQKQMRPGVSRQVRTTTFTHPSHSANAPSESYHSSHRVTRVLGHRDMLLEAQKAKEHLKEKMRSLSTASRKLLEELQQEAGACVMNDEFVHEDYESMQFNPPDDDAEWANETESPSPQMEIVHAIKDFRLHLLKGYRRRPAQSWKERRKQEMHGWDPLIDRLADAFLTWKYGTSSSDSTPFPELSHEYDYSLAVYEIFTLESKVTISRLSSSTSIPVDFAAYGYLTKTPTSPTIAVGFRTLELFHRLRQRQPSLSVEAFTKVICDYYQVPYRRHLRTILAETYEVFVRIQRVIHKRVMSSLGWDGENWRVSNSCPACCYQLQNEAPMKFSRLWAHDGNNSLKRMLPVGNRIAADTRVYNSDYILPREFVNKFADEVKSRPKDKRERHREMQADGSEDENEDEAQDDPVMTTGENQEGDPTDGVQATAHRDISQCVKNWKAAASDEKKRSWAIFDETGIYASACRHGIILWIADMVRSGELAKYPLAILAKALEVLPARSAGGMDIACGFAITAANSSLAEPIIAKGHKFVVNAFHGYSHNYQCQRKNHPTVVEGVGLEDFETMERTFSSSNGLAPSTRFASAFRRTLFTDVFFSRWDQDKYSNLGTFVLNNYRQALKILEDDVLAFEDAKLALNVSDDDLDLWEKEQEEFFANLGKEPEVNSLRVEYVELLQALEKAANEKANANSAFLGNAGPSPFISESPSSNQAAYEKAISATRKLETRRRVTRERYDNILHDVVEMEVQLQISRRWVSGETEYVDALKYIAERTYLRALDRVQQLVVQRLFELHKMNLSGTAYRTRTFLAKSLQTRSKAIRRAVANYNAAAAVLNPPRERINMADISQYNLIEQFALLQDTRNDIRDKPWAKPLYREVLRLRHRIARAKEEEIRCNIETRRLHTSIYDQAALFKTTLTTLKSHVSPIYGAVRDYATERTRVNQALLERVQQIHRLDGFTGDVTRGVRVGSTEAMATADEEVQTGVEDDGNDGDNEPGTWVDEDDLAVAAGLDADDSDVEEDDVEHDEEFQREVRGMENFFQTLSL